MPLHVDVVTIEREVYSAADVEMVIAPGMEGELGVLPRHEPVITALKEGVLQIVRGDEREVLAIGGGFLEIRHSQVVILADVAERADEIDVARAEAARERAQQALREAPRKEDAEEALHAMRRASVRLEVAKKARRRAADRPMGGGGG